MGEYIGTFSNQHVILPVIHAENLDQVQRNVDVVQEAGCDGFFLINMPGSGLDYRRLLSIHDLVAKENLWSGVNFLDLHPTGVFESLRAHPMVRGVWADHAGISPIGGVDEARVINLAKDDANFNGLYFGGVAFKYQEAVKDLELVAQKAVGYVDVITTSGDKTGQPPTVEKIRTIRAAIGEKPLAIASGLSPENIDQFLPYTNCFLVATSLLKRGTEDFDPNRVRDLVRAVR